ncbi:Heterogeneous nuclear ribonucleoprotein L [Halotydeus destructor]|nr:Heterogeneous nuclear ribonucleoprotein L [Halotydeus destructor]
MAVYDHQQSKRLKTDEERGFVPQSGYYGHSNSRYGGGPNRNEERENHVLLITVINPAYPITCDVIHQICSPQGKVLRVVIFKKNGVQAMVEFDNVDSARRCKQTLHGCDIYSGCCTLRIEFAKPTKLNVYKNDNESFDFTNPTLGKPQDRPALLGDPSGMGRNPMTPHQPYIHDHGDGSYHDGFGAPRGGQPYDPYIPHHQAPEQASVLPPPQGGFGGAPPPPPHGPGAPPLLAGSSPGNPGGVPGVPQQGAVMMVYGLEHSKISGDRLFNLFCLFGNVVRVKFLKSKEGCAMVQMGDAASIERCIGALNNLIFFGKKMQLGYSKQAYLNDVQQPYDLFDSSPSFKDYMGNRNNRFTNPEAASKNRISPPAKVLHFFNAPHSMTEEDIMNIFRSQGSPLPNGIKMFQSKTERSSSGLIQFDTVSEAVEALVLCNHISIQNPSGKFPFVFKLCFSSTGPRF